MPWKIKSHKPRQAPRPDLRTSARERGYTHRWDQYALWFLQQPENAICAVPGCGEPATVVDHIRPHKGDQALFWDESNHQGMCTAHHNQKTAREDGGFGNRRKSS